MHFFVGLCHVLSLRCIGQLYTIRLLLSDILGVVWKRLLDRFIYHCLEELFFNKPVTFNSACWVIFQKMFIIC